MKNNADMIESTIKEKNIKKEKNLLRNNNKKETKKQIVVDEKLKELEKRERENYHSSSWRRITSDGFYNYC